MTTLFSFSALPSTFGNQLLSESFSQPPSAAAPSAPATRERKRRRDCGASAMSILRGHAKRAGDDRAQVGPASRDDHFKHLDQQQEHEEPRHDELNRRRGLVPDE